MKTTSLSLTIGAATFAALAYAVPVTEAAQKPISIWKPTAGIKWQIVLNTGIKVDNLQPEAPVWDIDLYSNTNNGKDASKITKLKNAGKTVICYFNAGAYQPNQPDSGSFSKSDMGNELVGWPGEYWLKISNDSVRKIMANRIAIASRMGCDAIDPDNVDGYVSRYRSMIPQSICVQTNMTPG
jgi:hypothetical protein